MKKIVSLLLILAMIVLLVSCKSSETIGKQTVLFDDSLGWGDDNNKILIRYGSNPNLDNSGKVGELMESIGKGVYRYDQPENVNFILFEDADNENARTIELPFDKAMHDYRSIDLTDKNGDYYVTDRLGSYLSTVPTFDFTYSGETAKQTDDMKVYISGTDIQKGGAAGESAKTGCPDKLLFTLKNKSNKPVRDITFFLAGFHSSGKSTRFLPDVAPSDPIVIRVFDEIAPGGTTTVDFCCTLDTASVKDSKFRVYSYVCDGTRYSMTDESKDAWLEEQHRDFSI